MSTEAAGRADFSFVRYAQVWEDADVLMAALEPGPGDVCLSISSAGDNALSLVSAGAERVIAVDLNPAQLACLELRVAAFQHLEYEDLLALIGSRPGSSPQRLYQQIRQNVSPECRAFWDARMDALPHGIGHGGKFESYFRIFREKILPLVHSRKTVLSLLEPRSSADRLKFYNSRWNTLRWQWMFHAFFSRSVMGLLGRDPAFFKYVEGSVAARILDRTRHALSILDPSENPYLQWILTGRHDTALPHFLRRENFQRIRDNLSCLEWHNAPVEDFLEGERRVRFSKYNLSDIFEYMSEENTGLLLQKIASASRPGARLAYWNMLAPRSAPESLGLVSLTERATALHAQDKAFFYSRFVLEEVP